MQYVTRIAPSPTGDFHIGTARTAYFSWLAARASGGKFILRIDDTDQERHQEKAVEVILETMKWLGLDYDETFRQSNRRDTYKEIADIMLRNGTAVTLDGGAIGTNPDKFVLPDNWTDTIAGSIQITDQDRKNCPGVVLIKSDGFPTYQFSCVVDDHLTGVNYIIRGVDHISNTAKQVGLYNLLQWTTPQYAHVGLIHKDKKKISKRDGAASMLSYREKGYNPDAVLNFLLRMGWGPKQDDKSTAVLPKERALELFLSAGSMRAASSNFDQAKLDSFDRKYKAASK